MAPPSDSRKLTPVEGVPVIMERPTSEPVSAHRLQFSLSMVVGMVVVLLSGVASVSLVMYETRAHAADKLKHLDPDVMVQEGGVVTVKRLRKALRTLEMRCMPDTTRPGSGALNCKVDFSDLD